MNRVRYCDYGQTSASEVTTLWRYTNTFIIIIIFLLNKFFIPHVVKIPGVKNYKS